MSSEKGIKFLQWALPKMGYRWEGFKKPRGQILKRCQSRIQQLELTGGYDQYKKQLIENPEEWEQLDKLCDVTISKFYRDRKLWDYLRDHLMEKIFQSSQTDEVTIWSAGCCNAEEPYSIAMVCSTLTDAPFSVLATDRNTDVLNPDYSPRNFNVNKAKCK